MRTVIPPCSALPNSIAPSFNATTSHAIASRRKASASSFEVYIACGSGLIPADVKGNSAVIIADHFDDSPVGVFDLPAGGNAQRLHVAFRHLHSIGFDVLCAVRTI
jgi:hypothetical protein